LNQWVFHFQMLCGIYSTHQKEALAQNIPTLSLQNTLEFLVRTQHTPLHIQLNTMDNQLCVVCENRPKALSFDVNDNDWQQLEANGAQQEIQDGKLAILIPFIRIEGVLNLRDWFRVSRQFVVSVPSVAEIRPYFNNRLLLHLTPKEPKEVTVRRERVADFKVWLGK